MEAIPAPTTEQSGGLAENLAPNEDRIGEAHVPTTLPTGNVFTICLKICFYCIVILRCIVQSYRCNTLTVVSLFSYVSGVSAYR